MKKTFSTAFSLFCFLFLLLSLGLSSANAIYDSDEYGEILRLHVLANSDSDEDIALKYKVRDEVLSTVYGKISKCKNVEEALICAYENKSEIEDVANKVLTNEGSDKRARVEIGKRQYPEKKFANVTYPDGEYLSLRVVIGEGKGRNWWCVLFPSIYDEEYVKAKSDTSGEEKGQKGTVEIFGCRIKFKLFELL